MDVCLLIFFFEYYQIYIWVQWLFVIVIVSWVLFFMVILFVSLKYVIVVFEEVFKELVILCFICFVNFLDLDGSLEGSLQLFVGLYFFILLGDESGDLEIVSQKMCVVK